MTDRPTTAAKHRHVWREDRCIRCDRRRDPSILHWPNDPRIPKCNENCHRAEAQARQPDSEALRSALERLLANAEHIFDKKPVRDWGETLAEARAALAALPPSDPPALDEERLKRIRQRQAYQDTDMDDPDVLRW